MAPSAQSPLGNPSSFDLEVAARTLCQEARGEPLIGQQAVANVLKNRLVSGRWGHSLSSVCLWRAQFSGWYVSSDPNFAYACNLPDNDVTLGNMKGILLAVLGDSSDFTGGATHYFNPSVVNPPWADEGTFCGRFGHQSFYKDVK